MISAIGLGNLARWIAVVAGLAALGSISAAAAQTTPESAATLRALEQQLRSDDRFERLAALEAALASERTLERKIAFEVALGGGNMEMKSHALRHYFRNDAVYPLETRPTDKKESRERARELIGLSIEVREYDRESGQIKMNVGNRGQTGIIAQDHLVTRGTYCELSLKLAGAFQMQGVYRCQKKSDMAVLMRLN